ncbi:MAG: type V CRISPR-associated protein Cas12a/Cpf1 [Lentisphaeria bacterium]|nr:type V CRISPR-associated protein Cas12a/Cpf1 [Lentisphaeria bacterium]
MKEFTKQYKIAHTLTFELKPIGKTRERLEESGLLKQDFKRAEDYKKAKDFLDELHKKFLQDVLVEIRDINWMPLAEQLENFRKNKDLKKDLEKVQESFRKELSSRFTSNGFYKELTEATPSKLFKNLEKSGMLPDEIKTFSRFACYFKGYQENRKNIYSVQPQNTAAAYRAVNENFVKYANAVDIFERFYSMRPELLAQIAEKCADLIGDGKLADLLQINNYNNFLSQSGIDTFNKIVSEVNYAVNLFRQAHKEIPAKELPFLPVLFKQILSDREHAFALKEFKDDVALFCELKSFIDFISAVEIHGETVDLPVSLQRLFSTLTEDDLLYVNANSLSDISHKVTGRWDAIQDAMAKYSQRTFSTKKLQEKYCKQPVFSFNDIKAWGLVRIGGEEGDPIPVQFTDFWQNENVAALFSQEAVLRPQVLTVIQKESALSLRKRENDVDLIREYLDTLQNIFRLLKPLVVESEYGGDIDLLGILTEHYNKLENIIPLYKQTHNYVTKKIIAADKIKLMFNVPTLADGWDVNQERANAAVLLLKDGAYFLGIMNPKSKVDFEKYATSDTENCYQKMVCKLLPTPYRMLPKVFFAQSNIDFYNPSPDLLQKYKEKQHIQGSNFDLDFCRELIDFFKVSIEKHPDWSKLGFMFKETSAYTRIDEFYREVETQGYKVSFANISADIIDQLVSEGKLYLFQIWNKDFASGTHGTPDKFTLYWRALFDERNLSDVVFQLNGTPKLFFRETVIKSPAKHQVGEKMVNRTIIERFEGDCAIRTPIPESIHDEIFRFVNGRLEEELSSEAKKYLSDYPRLDWKVGDDIHCAEKRIVVKDVTHEIVKDKRFTKEKFQFHVPITVNFKSGDAFKFNDKVLEYLRNNPDVKVIGLDRGERHLIYLTLMDQQGNIIIQKSYNTLNGVEYHKKLDQREKERDNARKSWKSIGKIKELKDGYISGVVHEIVSMMVAHKAIVVMEDLNVGFKRGRMKIEKQIYQKFERALIEKLNYLVFKKTEDPLAPGGVLNGYQLTSKFESFKKLGKQCGFLFYVPAGYTSKIDPTTGFTNLFNMKNCTNAENRKAFLEQFDSIKYDALRNAFAFSFDYKNFKTGQTSWKTDWVVYSAQRRWTFSTRENKNCEIKPTQIILEALAKRDVCVADGFDLLSYIKSVEPNSANAAFFSDIVFAFDRTLQMRNTNGEKDYIESPVLNRKGEFFNSETTDASLPQNADANGAFHIALKGLYLLKKVIPGSTGKINFKIEHKDWFEFAQKRNI